MKKKFKNSLIFFGNSKIIYKFAKKIKKETETKIIKQFQKTSNMKAITHDAVLEAQKTNILANIERCKREFDFCSLTYWDDALRKFKYLHPGA